MRNHSKETFGQELSKVDWFSILLSVDVDYYVNEFNRIFSSVIDRVAPVREARVRSRNTLWINPPILS